MQQQGELQREKMCTCLCLSDDDDSFKPLPFCFGFCNLFPNWPTQKQGELQRCAPGLPPPFLQTVHLQPVAFQHFQCSLDFKEKTIREFNFEMSGRFCTHAMFSLRLLALSFSFRI